jgi:hypothetical protein
MYILFEFYCFNFQALIAEQAPLNYLFIYFFHRLLRYAIRDLMFQ